jgi:8-oxo-dGTP pyrophosphatase MutT (NUDIX family)
MSLLARIEEANRHDFAGFLPWYVAGQRVGCVRHAFAERLGAWPEVFRLHRGALRMAPGLDGANVPAPHRSEAIAQVCAALREQGVVTGWRDELYQVSRAWGVPPLALIERAAAALFGITAYGVHMNGFVPGADGTARMWIARRSMRKPTSPGKLDQMVAGGQPHGIGLRENMIKECAEEAGIPRHIAQRVRPAGAISYVLETPAGLRPDVLFTFDLELPADFQPVNDDGEVDAFYLWDLDTIERTVAQSDRFKFNCSLVIIDFLIRHGHIEADHPDYEALVLGLCRDPRCAPPSWVQSRA